jgi:hypothetical protein
VHFVWLSVSLKIDFFCSTLPIEKERKRESLLDSFPLMLKCLKTILLQDILPEKKIDRGRKTILQPIFCRIQLNEEENEKCSFQIMI